MVFFPHFRPLIPMIEKLEKKMKWKTDDYKTLFNEVFLNAVCGWTLGTGYYVNKPFLNALTSTCGFIKGECFVVSKKIFWIFFNCFFFFFTINVFYSFSSI